MSEYSTQLLCETLEVARSGFYKWLRKPNSDRVLADNTIKKEITHFFEMSDETYGSPRIHVDLKSIGISVGKKRVARLMCELGIAAQRSYKKRKVKYPKPESTAPNKLEQDFSATAPNEKWVTDITQVRTYEGWLYVAIIEDLFHRGVVGWSMKDNMKTDIVLDALTMAIYRRRPEGPLILHSDQGSQFGSDPWTRLCKENNIQVSMSRRGNCYDNAAMESFNGTLKKEKIRGKIYRTRDEARLEIFTFIETFYNSKRRHSSLGYLSPMEYELRYQQG